MHCTRLLVDLNTQRDFLCPEGAVRVLNCAMILPRIRALMRWARRQRVPVVSTVDAHRPGEPGNGIPRHCIDGTNGQEKLAFTLLPNRLLVEADNTHGLDRQLLAHYSQVIFRKRTRDVMGNPKADRLFSDLDSDELYVFGITVEHSVRPFVLGLLARRRAVSVVHDACGWWDPADAELAFRQMATKGARLVATEQLMAEVADARRQVSVLHRLSRRRRSARASRRG